MAKKKINLLFDATIIMNAYDKKQSCRSGIFFVALNVLKELCSYKNIKIYLYCQNLQLISHWKNVKKNFFEGLDCRRIFPCKPDIYNKVIYKISKNEEKYKYFKSKHQKFKCIKLILKVFYYKLLKFFLYSSSKKEFANIDVFFSPIYKAPNVIEENHRIKKYIILYDLIPCIFAEKYKDQLTPTSWFSHLLNSLNNDNTYFAISMCTKHDFLKYFPILQDDNIIVTPLGFDSRFHLCNKKQQNIIKKKYNIPVGSKYIFSLCNIDERKNLVREIKTFLEFIAKNKVNDMYFVIGGARIQSFMDTFERSLSELNLIKSKIIKAGYIDDEDLAPLYSGAEWFVYTSQYEGFGLPPLEAMACGCPVITSNNSSLPEVVGDAGIMIDWDSDEQHIKAYEKYYFDEEFRKKMAKKGLDRSKMFSWKKTVDMMVKEFVK